MTDDTAGPLGGRYRRERHLGRGAMGEVWLAEDLLLHRRVAIKGLAQSLQAPDPDDLERMMREARLAARLNHPNAVAVYDLIVADERPHVVMEFVSGETLAEEITKAGGRLDPQRVAVLGAAVAEALAEAHELGIVHRDVKPANILITKRGTPKLADFGIARITGDVNVTATGLMIGTPAYVAPEVARGGKADAGSDVWALGITLWAALEGRPPSHRDAGDSPLSVLHRVLTENVTPPPHGGPVGPAVMRMLDPDPDRRPSAEQVVTLLQRAGRVGAANQRPTAHPPAVPTPAPPPRTPTRTAPPPQFAPPMPVRPRAADSQQQRPPYPADGSTGGTGQSPSRRYGWIVAAVAGVVIVAAIAVGAVLLLHGNSGGTAVAGTSAAPASNPVSDPAGGTTTGAAPGSSGGGSSGGGSSGGVSSGGAGSGGQTYSAPGGLSVQGPGGWTEDDSSGVTTVHDFDAPGDDRVTGTYFRIGVGNPNPAASIKIESRKSQDYLTSSSNTYDDVVITNVRYLTYLGADAVDIEFTGTNQSGVARHAIERLWIADGETRIIQLNAPEADYSSMRTVFDQLVSTATVS